MDKIGKIKRLVEFSLDTSFGGSLIIQEIIVLPTQKFDTDSNNWVPDSFTIFLSVKNNEIDQPHSLSDNPKYKIAGFLESLLGFEVCVDVF